MNTEITWNGVKFARVLKTETPALVAANVLQRLPPVVDSACLKYKTQFTPLPVNTVAPVITGLTPVGSTLTVTNGTWTNPGTYTRQWKRDGVNIGTGATTYVTVAADDTHRITCEVTTLGVMKASNAFGPVTTVAALSADKKTATASDEK